MTHLDFTLALVRLSRHKVGVAEACTLFALAEETTSNKIGEALGIGNHLAKGRIGILKSKRLVESVIAPNGSATYRLTAKGAAIITATLKKGAKK